MPLAFARGDRPNSLIVLRTESSMRGNLPERKVSVKLSVQTGNIAAMINPASWRMHRQWILDGLEKSEQRQVDLCRYMGKSESWLSKKIKGGGLQDEDARKMREFFAKYIPGYAEMQSTPGMRIPDTNVASVPFRTEMPEDVQVLGTALGGISGGDFTMNGDSGLRVRRPPRLAGRTDIFALFVQGDSMSPRYPSGELIFLEAKRPPQIGDHVVVELVPDESGVSEAYIKLLDGTPPGKYRLRQYNPPRTLEIDRKDVLRLIRVLTTHDLLGV